MDIKLQGVRNIRDFSEYGFPGHIRSANMHDMTEGDAEVLSKQYHLKTVIDLRTTYRKERTAGPCHGKCGISAYSAV